jgi:hypothetical protein
VCQKSFNFAINLKNKEIHLQIHSEIQTFGASIWNPPNEGFFIPQMGAFSDYKSISAWCETPGFVVFEFLFNSSLICFLMVHLIVVECSHLTFQVYLYLMSKLVVKASFVCQFLNEGI